MSVFDLVGGSDHAKNSGIPATSEGGVTDPEARHREGIPESLLPDSTASSAQEVESVDLIREFYLTRLGQHVSESSNKVLRHARSSGESSVAASSVRNESIGKESKDGGMINSPFTIDKALLTSVGAINRQLEQYYRQVNESGNCAAWSSEDSLSRIYLDESTFRWPRPSELLGMHDASAELREALYALDRRDELCQQILAVQHCSLLAMSSSAPREPGFRSKSCSPSRDMPQSDSASRDAEELRRLRRMVELYKSELSRLYAG